MLAILFLIYEIEFLYVSILGIYSPITATATNKVSFANYSTEDIKVHRGDLKKNMLLSKLKAKLLSSLRLHNRNTVDNEEFYE